MTEPIRSQPAGPATGFFTAASGRFFVSPAGLVFELLGNQDPDGPDEILLATLPPDAEPLVGLFLLPSFVLRMAARLELEVPEPLRSTGAANCLDEIHWRAEAGGWAPVEGVDLFAVTALVGPGLVELSGERVRLGSRVVQVLGELTSVLCGQQFPAKRGTA